MEKPKKNSRQFFFPTKSKQLTWHQIEHQHKNLKEAQGTKIFLAVILEEIDEFSSEILEKIKKSILPNLTEQQDHHNRPIHQQELENGFEVVIGEIAILTIFAFGKNFEVIPEDKQSKE